MGIPTYLFTHTAIGNDVAVILMIALMMPFFFFAMFERDGQPAEKLLRNFIRARLWPGVRPYKTQNLYKYLQEEGSSIAETHKATSPAGAKASAKRSAGKKR